MAGIVGCNAVQSVARQSVSDVVLGKGSGFAIQLIQAVVGCRPNRAILIDEDVYDPIVADRVRIVDFMLVAGEFARLWIEPQQPRSSAEPKFSFLVLGNTMNGFCPAIRTSFVNDKSAS